MPAPAWPVVVGGAGGFAHGAGGAGLFMYLSIDRSIYPSIHPSIYLSIHPSIHPSIKSPARHDRQVALHRQQVREHELMRQRRTPARIVGLQQPRRIPSFREPEQPQGRVAMRRQRRAPADRMYVYDHIHTYVMHRSYTYIRVIICIHMSCINMYMHKDALPCAASAAHLQTVCMYMIIYIHMSCIDHIHTYV